MPDDVVRSAIALARPSLLREQCFVGGQWITARDGALLEVENPGNGDRIGRVPALSAAETRDAIAAAATAWPAWRALLAGERAKLLKRWHHLIVEHAEDLARILTLEQGKPLVEARGEIAGTAAFVEWFAEEARRAYGDTIPTHHRDKRLLVTKEPIGVCAAITPWNFPSSMITRKVAPALAAGCTVVLKPAEQTPFSALALADLASEAGIPAGVLNVITGDPVVIGAELTASRTVRKLAFTGSTEVGRLLMAQCAPTVKRLSLELGGNAPFIVFDDGDLDAATEAILTCKFRNAGQTCVSANRILVQRGIHEAFAAKLADAARSLRMGDGFDSTAQLGPLIDADAVRRMSACVADARDRGARVICGGAPGARKGYFFEPTIVDGVRNDMEMFRAEIFGPVAPLTLFDDEDEAIAMANDTDYGLAAYVFSRDLGRVMRVSEALEFGMVSVNTGAFATEVAPFGGMKQSGIGREASKYGLDEFLEVKYVCLAGIAQSR
ncbi:MAG TPA: NAD-dependent succinate-semialdehyde dehydrogenase [Burkholderiales bacterium]|nr:NAD-dependent succinate-semialdehyde dehydrogenase [Burkholderiales bacterium]